MTNTKYFTGKIFNQLEKVEAIKDKTKEDDLNLKRIKKSIFANIGSLTERYIKDFYNNSKDYEVMKSQQWISLHNNEFLLRNTIRLNNIQYLGLKIYKIEEFPEFLNLTLLISSREFLNMMIKDVFNLKLSDFNEIERKEQIMNKLILSKTNDIAKIEYGEDYVNISFNKPQKFSIDDLQNEGSFFKNIGIFSNQKQKIRADLVVKNLNTNETYFIEVKSRAGSGLKLVDIYSSIYYPIYHNYKYNDNRNLRLIYLGDLDISTDLKELSDKYKSLSNSKFKMINFESVVNYIQRTKKTNLTGYKMDGIKNNWSDKYEITELYEDKIRFILDYTFNLNLDIKEVTKDYSRLTKEITRDSRRNLK